MFHLQQHVPCTTNIETNRVDVLIKHLCIYIHSEANDYKSQECEFCKYIS